LFNPQNPDLGAHPGTEIGPESRKSGRSLAIVAAVPAPGIGASDHDPTSGKSDPDPDHHSGNTRRSAIEIANYILNLFLPVTNTCVVPGSGVNDVMV
jgi:hypothetical protein